MASVRDRVRLQLRNGEVTGASPLRDVAALGAYLAGRLTRAGMGPSVQDLWAATRGMTTQRLEGSVHRALQNARGNQCVSPRTRRSRGRYHAGDVNQHGYEAVVALLDHARRRGNVRYGALPIRFPARHAASKSCACRATCDGVCVPTADGGCVPRAHNARGFVGVRPHADQSVRADSARDRRDVLRRSRSPTTAAARRDPDTRQDILANAPAALQYSVRGNRMWRRAGPKVRMPV